MRNQIIPPIRARHHAPDNTQREDALAALGYLMFVGAMLFMWGATP